MMTPSDRPVKAMSGSHVQIQPPLVMGSASGDGTEGLLAPEAAGGCQELIVEEKLQADLKFLLRHHLSPL